MEHKISCVFDDIKVGDVYLEKSTNRKLTVTELTDRGFKYSCVPYFPYPARYDGGFVKDGELFIKDPKLQNCWNFLYEKVKE